MIYQEEYLFKKNLLFKISKNIILWQKKINYLLEINTHNYDSTIKVNSPEDFQKSNYLPNKNDNIQIMHHD